MSDTMLAVVKRERAPGVSVERVPIRRAGPGEIRLRVTAASICGTDLHIHDWNAWAASAVKVPVVIGHEVTGEVVEAGAGVTTLKPGDRVSLESHIVCGECVPCRADRRHVCERTKTIGIDVDGGYAEYATVPAAIAWKHRGAMAPEVGTVMEPLGNAVHCAQEAEVAGRSVAVFGCGPSGLFTVAACRAMGAGRVAAVDVDPGRRELAKRMGADAVVDGAKPDLHGLDVAFEMSGAAPAIENAFASVRNGGTVIAFGLPSKPVEVDWADGLILRGIRVQGVVGRRIWGTWDLMQSLLDSGKLDPRPAITHTFKLSEFPKAIALLKDRRTPTGKVVILP